MTIVPKQCVYKFTRLRAVRAATARLLYFHYLCNCSCSDQPLDVYINMNVNDISSISETKMVSIQWIEQRITKTIDMHAKYTVYGF